MILGPILVGLCAATIGAPPFTSSRPSEKVGVEQTPCEPRVLVWREESRVLEGAAVELYERLVFPAAVRQRRLSDCDLADYRHSLRRVLRQYAARIAAADKRGQEGFVYWLAWCTLEACERDPVAEASRLKLRDEYMRLFSQVQETVRAHLIPGPLGQLSPHSREAIEERLRVSSRTFEERLRALQTDFLYPAMKSKLSPQQEAGVKATFENPAMYPTGDEPAPLMVAREERYLKGALKTVDDAVHLVLFDILAQDLRPRLRPSKWWGPMLRRAESVSGYWPALIQIWPEPPAKPTTTRSHAK